MGRLAENLTPPYYAAVLNENQSGVKDEEHVAPADEMVSLAQQFFDVEQHAASHLDRQPRNAQGLFRFRIS